MTQSGGEAVVFQVEKIYLKDVSYEAPGVPLIFSQTPNAAAEIGVHVSLGNTALARDQGLHEVVLTITATAKHEDRTIFLVEVKQAGIFRISGMDNTALQHALEVGCGYVLLPFAREAVNGFVEKGGFPQLLINPINFDALYEQKRSAPAGQQGLN